MFKVLLADADLATRKGLTLLLTRKLGLTDICEATNGSELLAQLKDCKPGLLILDWSLPNRPSLETCRALRDASAPMRWVLLSVAAEDTAYAQVLDAIFIHKSTPAEQVLAQLRNLLPTVV